MDQNQCDSQEHVIRPELKARNVFFIMNNIVRLPILKGYGDIWKEWSLPNPRLATLVLKYVSY